MNESQAEQVAQALSGEAWQSGGDIWLVLLRRTDGKLTVVSDEVVCEHDNEECFEKANPAKTVLLH